MSSTLRGKNYWRLTEIACFADPNIDGQYYSEFEDRMPMGLAPNIRAALETVDRIIADTRKALKDQLERLGI